MRAGREQHVAPHADRKHHTLEEPLNPVLAEGAAEQDGQE